MFAAASSVLACETMRQPANSVRSTECRYSDPSGPSGAVMQEVSVFPVHGAMHVSAECLQIMRYRRCSFAVIVSGTSMQCSDVTCTASWASCGLTQGAPFPLAWLGVVAVAVAVVAYFSPHFSAI